MQLNTRIHPMGDLIFNPTARPGDADWRVLYIGCGDGGSGESRTADPHESAAARHARRQDPPHRSRPDRARRRPARSARTAATAFPNDNPFVVDAGRAEGNLGVRLSQSASAELGDRSGECREQPPDRQLDRPAHVGDRQHRPQGRELRLLAARGQRAAEARQHDRPRCPTVDKIPVQISDTVTDGTVVADLSGDPVRARAGRRRRDRQRVRLSRQGDSGAARASTSSPTSRPAASGTPTTKRCSPPTMAIRRRWRRCTK